MHTPQLTPAMIEALNADMTSVSSRMSDKGFRNAYCNIEFCSSRRCRIFFHGYYGETGDDALGEFVYFDDDGYAEALAKAHKIVSDAPSLDEKRVAAFRKNLANIIDEGNRIGMSIDFMNPLTEAMKQLSENAITDQRAAAE